MNINELNLKKNIFDKLNLNEINTVGKLLIINRKELTKLGFTREEINLIEIKLELNSLSLNKRKNLE